MNSPLSLLKLTAESKEIAYELITTVHVNQSHLVFYYLRKIYSLQDSKLAYFVVVESL